MATIVHLNAFSLRPLPVHISERFAPFYEEQLATIIRGRCGLITPTCNVRGGRWESAEPEGEGEGAEQRERLLRLKDRQQLPSLTAGRPSIISSQHFNGKTSSRGLLLEERLPVIIKVPFSALTSAFC